MTMRLSWRVVRRLLRASVPFVAITPLALWAFLPTIVRGGTGEKRCQIVVYGFSALEPVMNGLLFPAFEEEWRAKSGEQVDLIASFAGSGTITNMIAFGAPADVAIFSRESDALRLASLGIVGREAWRSLPHAGVLARSPVALLVREGNPKTIRGFEDLSRPGIRIIHPDPITSGAGNWALVAEWKAASDAANGNRQRIREQLIGLWRNVVAQVSSARAGRTQFAQGYGDVLITYEQEIRLDQAKKKLLGEIVLPRPTVETESTVVRFHRPGDAGCDAAVDAFVEFLWSETSQAIFEKYGFERVDAAGREDTKGVFTVRDLGGWESLERDVVDRLWRDEIVPELAK